MLLVIIYTIKLFELQILDTQYKENADSNAFFRKVIYASRGLIYDRSGKLIVYNQPAYDIVMIPRDIQEFDTIDFCNTLRITKEQLKQRFEDLKNPRINANYSAYTQQTLISHLSTQDYGRIQEKLYKFPGFFIQKRVIRQYNEICAANVLGNIREVNGNDIEKDDYYKPGDYAGDLGVEKSYEKILRGSKGEEILIRDAHGRIKGNYENGKLDVLPVSGKDLVLSIDVELQKYGEQLMQNKIGAIVAIEPSTGEILAMVSSPTYDPTLLIGKARGHNYKELVNYKYKPLFDRSLMGAYPPGSTFKPTQGLIFLQESIIGLSTMYPCHHGYINGRIKVGCHGHASPLSLKPALETSCNAFFCWGFKNMIDLRAKYGTVQNSFEVWKKHLVSMGFGYKLGVDLPSESRGFIPNSAFYNKAYGKKGWRANTIISDAIGQGEILATPLQIANLCATIANRGYFITPHVVRQVKGDTIARKFKTKRYPTIKGTYYQDVAEGMRMAVLGGTCRQANIPGLDVCGKTGTAQNPHGRDHSAFIGFAPMNNPKIAICVYVENAGFGATFGVPIGSLMIEKYLNGKISNSRQYIEDRMLKSNTIIYSGVKKH